MRITNNVLAMNTQRMLQSLEHSMTKNMEKLASGRRINRAADDAANLPISEKMRNQVSGLKLAMRNSQDGISMVQTIESALIETLALLNRMRNLAVQSGNGALQDDDRAKLNKEFVAYKVEINRIAVTTEFNSQKLLDGSLSDGIVFHVGANTGDNDQISVVLPAVTVKALGIKRSAIDNREEALSAIYTLDAASDIISAYRSTLGSVQNQLEHTINNLGVIAENMASSVSRIRDADMGNELTSFSKNQILNQSATAVLAQANAKPQNVLKVVR